MPAFYPRAMADSMPLTPPDSGSGFGYSSMHYCQDPYAQSSMSQPRHDAAYDYQQSYMQPAVAPAPPSYASYGQQSGGFQSGTNLPSIHSYYEPMGAPILPPLRIQDRVSFADDYQRCLRQEQHNAAATREQQRHVSKEEKPIGGVSATLDYDMDVMTDYVVHAAQSIFRYTMQSVPSFRKWVFQVLSATRLPSSTILLSMHFLNDRMVNHSDSVLPGENQVYRLLAVSLILGSKFLDDNTFINRSWSDVTAIKVWELNQLEMQWLRLLDYRLHVDPESPTGLKAWLDSWKAWLDSRKRWEQSSSGKGSNAYNRQTSSVRLSPLNTHTSHRYDRFSPYPSPFSASTSRFPESSSASSAHSLSRLSAFSHPSAVPSSTTSYASADPWQSDHRTPFDDFYKRQNRFPTLSEIDDVNRRFSAEAERSRNLQHAQPAPAYHQAPAYQAPQQQAPQPSASMSSYYHPQSTSASTSAYNSPWSSHDAWGTSSSSNGRGMGLSSSSSQQANHYQPQYSRGASTTNNSNNNMNNGSLGGGLHRFDCGCAACAYQQPFARPWTGVSAYGAAQTVMG